MIRWDRTLAIAFATLAFSAPAAHAAWLEPSDLSPANPAGKAVGAPSLAVARDGTAYAAFQRWDGKNFRVAVAERDPGGSFGAPRDLSPANADAFGPVIALDRQGNASLAWQQGPGFSVQARFKPVGEDWGAIPAPLSADGVGAPVIAAGDDGAAVVAWNRAGRVEAVVRPSAGAPFGAPLPASPNAGTGICQPPRVAMDAAGDVAVIWTRRTSAQGDFHVESATKAAGAPAFAPFEARSTTVGNSNCNTDIQMTADGRVTAMWDFTTTGSPSAVFFADRLAPFATGTFRPAGTLSADASTRPQFALDDAGNAAAIWFSRGQILSAVRPGIGPFRGQTPLSGATDLRGAAIAAAANGDAVTTFVGTSNGSDALFSARAHDGGDLGDVTPVATTTPGETLDSPDVALDEEGNGFAVWQRTSPTGISAQVAAFDPVAPVITAASVPANATAGQPVGMAAAARDRMSDPRLSFDFGDGSSAAGAAVTHIYASAGTFTVTVTATDAAGNRSTTTRAIQVAPAPIVIIGNRPEDNRPKSLTAAATASWDRLKNGRTRMLTLEVDELSGPETVKLACKGKGCRKSAKKTVTRHRRNVDLTKQVKGMILHPKAKLTVTVTRPGFVSRIVTYTMIAHKNPKKTVRCLAPGAKKEKAC